jgi:hypothetical protein
VGPRLLRGGVDSRSHQRKGLLRPVAHGRLAANE